jgi:hypothetical protein
MYEKIIENLTVNGYHIGHFNEFFNELKEAAKLRKSNGVSNSRDCLY